MKAPTADARPTAVDEWLGRFDCHLDHVAGCELKSRGNYLRYARRLLYEVFAGVEVDWSKLSASVVTNFVRREAAKLKPSACGQPVTAVRSLIRFLALEEPLPRC